jgi:hypothetical protein
MDNVSRETGRKGTLKKTTVEVIPKNLVENTLVKGSIESIIAVQGK